MKYDNRKKADKLIRSSAAEYLTYVAAAGENGVELRYEDENIWLTQKMLSVLYGVSTSAINQHIKKIYEDKELEEKSTIKKFLIVQDEGNRKISRNVIHYNLQMIIAVGFNFKGNKEYNTFSKDTVKNGILIELTKNEMFKDKVQQLIKNIEKTTSKLSLTLICIY